MSTNDPIDLKQDRRQWLKTSATMVGASLLPLPAVAAETSQAEAKPRASTAKPDQGKSATHFFTPAQFPLLEELSEKIIPADSPSAGAIAAKRAHNIDKELRET